MELKPGYKQTEAGVIPEKWRVATIKELALIKTGKRNTQDRVDDGAYPFFVRSQVVERINSYSFDGEAVLTAGDGVGTGKVFHYIQGRFDIHQRVYRISSFSHDLNGYYFFLYFSNHFYDRIMSMTAKSSVDSVRLEMIAGMAIPLPSPAEQRTIADALHDVEVLIVSLDKLIAKKRDLKQAAMQQLLTGQTRLPGFSGEWEVERLGEIGDISSAGADKKSLSDEVPVRLVNYLDVYHRDFIYSGNLNHWVTAPLHQARRCAVQKGDVFFTPSSETRDDIGMSAVAMEDIPDAAYSYHVVRLRLRDEWDLRFRAYAFKTRAFLDQAEMLCDGSGTRYVISQTKFKSMKVQVPPVPEQTAIAAVLYDMDAELAALEQRRAKTRALKQGMMQELLTGRTRIV
jgi:type I restriction enzyme S subunit